MFLHALAFEHPFTHDPKDKVISLLKQKADINHMNTLQRTPTLRVEANAILIVRGEYSKDNPFLMFLRDLGAKEGQEILLAKTF